MMLQGMQQAAAGMPGGMAPLQQAASHLQSPPTSAGPGGQFVLLPQGHNNRQESKIWHFHTVLQRYILAILYIFLLSILHRMEPGREGPSPNSTPNLQQQQQHPGPTQTPPNLGGLDFNERNWAANQNLFLGPRMPAGLGEKSLEEQMKQQQGLDSMFALDPAAGPFAAAGSQQERAVAAQLAAHQQAQADMAARMNQFAAAAHGMNPHQFAAQQMAAAAAAAAAQQQQQQLPPHHPAAFMPPPPSAQSPPGHLGHQQQIPPQHLQMPPRPRPEGGQDPPPSFLSEQDGGAKAKQDLVIDSWSNDDATKGPGKHFGGMRHDDGTKGEDGGASGFGWGGPPPGEFVHSKRTNS